MSNKKPIDVGEVWWFWFSSSAFNVDKRLRRIMRDDRVELRVHRLQPAEGGLRRLLRGDLAGADQRGELRGRKAPEIGHVEGPGCLARMVGRPGP